MVIPDYTETKPNFKRRALGKSSVIPELQKQASDLSKEQSFKRIQDSVFEETGWKDPSLDLSYLLDAMAPFGLVLGLVWMGYTLGGLK